MYSKKSMSILLLTYFILQFANLSSANEIITKSQTYEVPEGGRIVLDCMVKDNPNEDKILWSKVMKNGESSTIYVGNYRVTKDPHFNQRFPNNSIEIVNANKDDEGQYECLFTVGTNNKVIHQLVIQYKPIIDSTQQVIEVIENSNVDLVCKAEGVPKPTFTWERKGILPHNFNKDSDSNVFLAEADLSGQYFCSASNLLGTVSKTFVVDVKYKPEVTITEQVNSGEPSTRNVLCTVRSNPKPEDIQFYKVGSSAVVREIETIEDETNPFLTKFVKVFEVRDDQNYGEYVCEARNTLGSNRKAHNVTMERPKPEKARIIDFPMNGRLYNDTELQWYVKSEHEIINFEATISKQTMTLPSKEKVKSLLYVIDNIKPKRTEENEYTGSIPLSSLDVSQNYEILIKTTNAYGQISEVELEFYLEKSLKSNASQSLLSLFLILAISFYHFRTIRLH